MNDQKKFALLMAKLATAFERNGITEDRIALYWEYLNDLPITDLEGAADDLIRTRKINCLPTIAELREKATNSSEGELGQRALVAWNEANESIILGGGSADPVTNEAVRLAFGSWERFGMCAPEQESFDRNHFVKVYKDLARRQADYPLLDLNEVWEQLAENKRHLEEAKERQDE